MSLCTWISSHVALRIKQLTSYGYFIAADCAWQRLHFRAVYVGSAWISDLRCPAINVGFRLLWCGWLHSANPSVYPLVSSSHFPLFFNMRPTVDVHFSFYISSRLLPAQLSSLSTSIPLFMEIRINPEKLWKLETRGWSSLAYFKHKIGIWYARFQGRFRYFSVNGAHSSLLLPEPRRCKPSLMPPSIRSIYRNRTLQLYVSESIN